MSITRRGHRQPAFLRVFEGIKIVPSQRGRGIEHFNRVDRQRLEHGKTDSRAEQVVGVGRDGQTSAFMDQLANFASWAAFKFSSIHQGRSDAEQVTLGGSNLNPGDDEKVVDRLAVFTHKSLMLKIMHCLASVVIGNRKSMQTLCPRRSDDFLRARNAVTREERVGVQVYV